MTALAVAGWAVAVLVAVAAVVVHRRWTQRLRQLTDTLAPAGAGVPARRGEAALVQLERAAERELATTAGRDQLLALLAAALDHAPQGVLVADGRGQVVYRNAAARAADRPRVTSALVDDALTELLAGALAGTTEERTLELHGPPRRTFVVSAAPLGGGVDGAVGIIDDVSERARLEAARTDFVANISHELRTPVGAMALLAETLAGEEDPAVVRRLSQRMLGEAHRVGRTVEDLLELSRIEAGSRPVREVVGVGALVAEAVDRVAEAAAHRDVAVDQVVAAPAATLVGDRRQLLSALVNLLENAVKYSDAGSRVEVQALTGPDVVELVVRDRGIGIPPRDRERIFERFYRVDRARSRDTGGTGLGLAIVRHVATSHGGEVSLESTEGAGSTFRLRLPTRPPDLRADEDDPDDER